MVSFFTFAILAALPVATAGVLSYVVKAGDTCDSISAANNASTYQLAIVNSGTIDPSCSNLAIGATICLASPGQDCSQTHVVQTGETCNQLESVFGINSTILWANNPQINEDCTNMYTGEVICTAGQVFTPSAPVGSVAADPSDIHPASAPPATTSVGTTTTTTTSSSSSTSPPTTTSTSTSTSSSSSSSSSSSKTTSTSTSATPTPTPDSGDDGDDGDDNLPWCDEL
ncbi:hypothetical protein SISNIDRAFT_497653 [Sistotremastrum niveocremeum HHB9708]|uniref:LysM domain-containing protein n=1 Tax=Sistotremastrum niveocremeum HHB9708 TaxID=1314777 RepID=A0A164PWG7_9AGAM|nr:hypothetical protein SISNIDRAFT_497653 [Sistotremastrum niveocremeum HHB9708]